MGDYTLGLVLFNSSLVSGLLWGLTFTGTFLYDSKHDLNREMNFECGFFSINKVIPEYSLNFIISAVFLVLYDIEFISLIPVFFNVHSLSWEYVLSLILFLTSVIFSLILDVESGALKWYYN